MSLTTNYNHVLREGEHDGKPPYAYTAKDLPHGVDYSHAFYHPNRGRAQDVFVLMSLSAPFLIRACHMGHQRVRGVLPGEMARHDMDGIHTKLLLLEL